MATPPQYSRFRVPVTPFPGFTLYKTGYRMWYLVLCLYSLSTGPVLANPVPADEVSLSNGAYLYDLYCSECHGGRTSADDYGPGAGSDIGDEYDFSDLIDIAEGANAASADDEDDSWPDWVKYSEEETAEDESAAQTEIINEMAQVIDEAYGIGPESGSGSEPGQTESGSVEAIPDEQSTYNVGVFDPDPGVPDLADPQSYFYGASEDEMFNSIADGTGVAMPGWRIELGSDEDIWDLINYIRSFWSDEWLY